MNSVLICLTRKAFSAKTLSFVNYYSAWAFLITYTFLPEETRSVGPESVSTVVTFVGSGLSAMMKKQVYVTTHIKLQCSCLPFQ